MSAVPNTQSVNFLNATLPTAAGGKPGTWTALSSAAAMFARLNSALYSGANPGASEQTQLPNGNGYVTNGQALGQVTGASLASNVETVTLPATALTWTNGSGGWTVSSVDLTDSALAWAWFGNFNGAPITIAAGNTLQVSANAVAVTQT